MTDPTLKVHESDATSEIPASLKLTKNARAPETVDYTNEDDDGRETKHKLTLRKPDVLANFQMVEALGDVASNAAYMQMVAPLVYVSEIDGDPVYPPTSKLEVEALIQRLGEGGMAAAMNWWMERIYSPALQNMRDAQAKAKETARLKNG